MEDPGLPIKLGPCSNSEFPPQPATETEKAAIRLARQMSEENARRLGMDRRQFLFSSMGAAVGLYALGACSSGKGGTLEVSEDATRDPDAAQEELGKKGSIIDVQTHLLNQNGELIARSIEPFPGAECADPADCYSAQRWRDEIFGRSDTDVAILSAVPIVGGDALTPDDMARERDLIDEICGLGHVLQQGHAWVNIGDPQEALEKMDAEAENYPLVAWKTYTHVGPGFSLDDHHGLEVGGLLLGKIEDIADRGGPSILCVHKGLHFGTGDLRFSSPDDIGRAAKDHANLTFVVYHSGFEPNMGNGPYDPNAEEQCGVDILIKSLEEADIGPDGNVYAEIGAAWKVIMKNPDAASHFLGKLLVAVGPDRILWGTDSPWFGTPQDQILALRTFQITPEFQERFGYPELTDEIKEKIFWRNAARLYDIQIPNTSCNPNDIEAERIELGTKIGNRMYGPMSRRTALGLFVAEHHWAFRR